MPPKRKRMELMWILLLTLILSALADDEICVSNATQKIGSGKCDFLYKFTGGSCELFSRCGENSTEAKSPFRSWKCERNWSGRFCTIPHCQTKGSDVELAMRGKEMCAYITRETKTIIPGSFRLDILIWPWTTAVPFSKSTAVGGTTRKRNSDDSTWTGVSIGIGFAIVVVGGVCTTIGIKCRQSAQSNAATTQPPPHFSFPTMPRGQELRLPTHINLNVSHSVLNIAVHPEPPPCYEDERDRAETPPPTYEEAIHLRSLKKSNP